MVKILLAKLLANQCKIKHVDHKTNSTSQHDGFGR
jgi:hypothetical protein